MRAQACASASAARYVCTPPQRVISRLTVEGARPSVVAISCLQNKGNALPSDSSLAFPNALAAKGNLLAVSDHTNNRTMFFDLPIMTNQSASKQIGQPDFVTATNVTPPTASSVTTTKGLIFDQQYIWIGDGGNHRLAVIPLP